MDHGFGLLTIPPPTHPHPIRYAIGYSKANAPLAQDLYADDVGTTGLFLASDLSRCVTGVTLYVDNGLHVRGLECGGVGVGGRVCVCVSMPSWSGLTSQPIPLCTHTPIQPSNQQQAMGMALDSVAMQGSQD